MTTYLMNLDPLPFEKIKSGKKIYELRLLDEKRKLLQTGDFIVFVNNVDGERLTTQIEDLLLFNNFADLYAQLPMQSCGYEPDEVAAPVDMEKYYSKEEQAQYGAVAIKIRLIPS